METRKSRSDAALTDSFGFELIRPRLLRPPLATGNHFGETSFDFLTPHLRLEAYLPNPDSRYRVRHSLGAWKEPDLTPQG